MSRADTLVSAEAWDDLVEDLKALGPNPPEAEVLTLLLGKLWATEGITLDEDNRRPASPSAAAHPHPFACRPTSATSTRTWLQGGETDERRE